MTFQRGPHYSHRCPFYVTPYDPLTADQSIRRCVECATHGCQGLQHTKADLHQIAYLTILENTPRYDHQHASGASFITFIRSHVCARLWNETNKALKSTPYSVLKEYGAEHEQGINRLVDGLVEESLLRESVEDAITRHLDVEHFKRVLPQLLMYLSDNERTVIDLKFFEGLRSIEIAELLNITKGRVSQLSRTALERLAKAYLCGVVLS